MSITDALRSIVSKTPLIKVVHKIQLTSLKSRFKKVDDTNMEVLPVIGISPPKTGTTFITSCYDKTVATNNSLQHFTLKYLEHDFDSLFIKRFNLLKFKLDCTGTWSYYIEKLAQHPIGKDLHFVFVIRKPSDWIKSTINYFLLANKTNYYNYYNEYFWKSKVGVDLMNYNKFSPKEQNRIIEKLIAFYFEVTRKSTLLKNVHYVRLSDINLIFPIVDKLINEEADLSNAFKRKMAASKKSFDYENDRLNSDYEDFIETLGIKDKLVTA